MSKKVTPLSTVQQLALRNRAKAELTRLETIITNTQTTQRIEDFKAKFTRCEIVYKVILADHQQNKTGTVPDRMQVTMTQVPYALQYAGYHFQHELLKNLFGAEEKIGERSVKKLRDALTHAMKQNAIDELEQRYEELNGYMDSFLDEIRTFDDAAA